MLQLQRYAPPRLQAQPLKPNNSQREGNTEARLPQLYKEILGLNRKYAQYWTLVDEDPTLPGETSQYQKNMDACEKAMRALHAEFKTLVGNDKDLRWFEELYINF